MTMMLLNPPRQMSNIDYIINQYNSTTPAHQIQQHYSHQTKHLFMCVKPKTSFSRTVVV